MSCQTCCLKKKERCSSFQEFIFIILGTLISAFAVFCCGKHGYEKNIVAFLYNILAAILQSATIFLLVGWIWSIRWGILFVQLSGIVKIRKFMFPNGKRNYTYSFFFLRVSKILRKSCEYKSIL